MSSNISNISSIEEKNEQQTTQNEVEDDKPKSFWNIPIEKFKKGDMKHRLVAESDFKVNFPQYREKYIREIFPVLKKTMKEQGIIVELDALKGSLSVRTTEDTWDPYAILFARDTIKLVSRHVDLERALKVFEEGITHEIVNIRRLCSEEVLVKRRNRLLGHDNKSLILLQKLSGCDIIIQGGTVAIIGPYKGVHQIYKIVTANMKDNVHPVVLISRLFQKKKFENDPEYKDLDWDKLLPGIPKTQNTKKKSKKNIKEKKEYQAFPPEQIESKLDGKLQDGEFFMKDVFKKGAFNKTEQKKRSEKRQAEKRSAQYIAPEEPVVKKRKRDEIEKDTEESSSVDLKKLKKKVKKHKKKTSE